MDEPKKIDWVRVFNKPEIGKRFRYIGYQFAMFYFFLTVVFVRTGLIDKNHPVAVYSNVGKYGFFDVLKVAYSSIRWTKSDIPKILMFFAVVASFVFMVLCIGIIVMKFALSAGTAYAQNVPALDPAAGSFENPVAGAKRGTDLVYLLLSNIFGDTGMGYFADPGSGNVTDFNITWLHKALTSMLSYYSIAMMVIAAFIICYYLASVLLETTAEGKPFGDRFNVVWAPVRFVICLSLLAPISNGYNMAQLIVFQAADWGSGLASHIWAVGLNSFGDQKVIGEPGAGKGTKFIRSLWLSSVCMNAWNQYAQDQSKTLSKDIISIRAFPETVKGGDTGKMQAVVFSFGTLFAPDYCGSVRVPVVEDVSTGKTGIVKNQAARIIQAQYQDIFSMLVGGLGTSPIQINLSSTMGMGMAPDVGLNGGSPEGGLNVELSKNPISVPVPVGPVPVPVTFNKIPIPIGTGAMSIHTVAQKFASLYNPENGSEYGSDEPFENAYFQTGFQNHWMNVVYEDGLKKGINAAAIAQEAIAKQMVREGATLGWGQAGAYFITLASMNGSMSSAVENGLEVIKLPALLSTKGAKPGATGFWNKLLDVLYQVMGGWIIDTFFAIDKDKAALYTYDVLDKANLWWNQSPLLRNEQHVLDYNGSFSADSASVNSAEDSSQGFGPKAWFNKAMASVTRGISGAVTNIVKMDNTMNPFGYLTSLGSTLLTTGGVFLASGIALVAIPYFGALLTGVGYILMGLAWTIMSAGLALYVVVPLIPFFYFTMSVINWAMGIFQAVVAMPLWALSFLKIDGDGPIPQDSKNALIIILQIFLRPPMMIIALLGSMLVFSGAIMFLNNTFGLLVMQMVGEAGSTVPVVGILGKALMGVIMIVAYVYMVYSLAMAIFKMVDTIPNQIIDYFGVGGITPMTDFDDPTRKSIAGMYAVGAAIQSTHGSFTAGKKKEKDEKKMKDIYTKGKEDMYRDSYNVLQKDHGEEAANKYMSSAIRNDIV